MYVYSILKLYVCMFSCSPPFFGGRFEPFDVELWLLWGFCFESMLIAHNPNPPFFKTNAVTCLFIQTTFALSFQELFFFCSHRAEKISGQEESLSCLQLIVRHPFFEAFFGVATWQVLLRSNCCVWSFLCVCVCATLDPVVGVYSIQNIHIVFSGTCLAW